MSLDFEQAKRLVLAMNAVNDQLPDETRERCREMLKENKQESTPLLPPPFMRYWDDEKEK